MVASIEAPFALFQKPVEILLLDAVKLAQMPFGLVPEILNTVDVILAPGKQLAVIDAPMMKVRDIQRIIATKIIRINDAVRHYLLCNDG